MIRNSNPVRHVLAAAALVLPLLNTIPAQAQEPGHMTPAQTLAEIQAMFGGVPTFVKQLPDAAIPG